MYYIFRLNWSQTDESTCIVEANSKEEAREKIKASARYIICIGSTDAILK